jgi:hypothetical protein
MSSRTTGYLAASRWLGDFSQCLVFRVALLPEHIGRLGMGSMFGCCSMVAVGRSFVGEEGARSFSRQLALG